MALFDNAKLIRIVDPAAGRLQETMLTPPEHDTERPLFESKHGRTLTLREVAENNLSIFPSLLRDGLRGIVYESYAGTPTTWGQWTQVVSSDKQQEDWLEESGIGLIPQVAEGSPYPSIMRDLDRTVQITNAKVGAKISVTEEMI